MSQFTKLDKVLEEIVSRWGIPGLGAGVVQEGETVYTRGLGVQSLESGRPVTPDSIFCVASVSKCFTASDVMQLVERGKIGLEAPIAEYLPYFRLDDMSHTQITIPQILSHTSGMPDFTEHEYDELVTHPEVDEGSSERLVRSLGKRKMIAAPGEHFAYSNIGYNVLGDLIAKLSGQTFEAYMKEQILIPAGMLESTFFYPEVKPARLAVPYLRSPEMIVNPMYPYHRADAPASFLHSSVIEMCHGASPALTRGFTRDSASSIQQVLNKCGHPLLRGATHRFMKMLG
jgi:CubicO group peptidase (beta-lactamase class C family)